MADRDQPTGDGQARSLSNLEVTHSQLDSDYDVRMHDLARGETGLLRVFSLVPKTGGKPSFEARVDDGSSEKRRDPELDFDIKGVSAAIESDFKAERNGYFGHHTNKRSTPDLRIFDVEIATPAGKVFEGTVSFNANFQQELRRPVTIRDTLDAEVIRAPKYNL